MVMHSIRERPAPGAPVEGQVEPAPAGIRVEHPPQAVIRFWGFMMTALSEKAWNVADVILPFAALGVNAFLWLKFMPSLTETQLYGLGAFGVFSLLLLWIGRRATAGSDQ